MNRDQIGTASRNRAHGSKIAQEIQLRREDTDIVCADKRSRPGERTGIQRSSGICQEADHEVRSDRRRAARDN